MQVIHIIMYYCINLLIMIIDYVDMVICVLILLAFVFKDLKPVGTNQSKTHALNLENKPKNRYNNVLPCESP